jgi:hypothetical protein
VPRALDVYALVHFFAILPMTVGLMAAADSLSRAEAAAGAVLVLWALLNLGGIFDHRRWALVSECLRLPATAVAVGSRLPDAPWRWPALAGLALAVAASWLCLTVHRRVFDGAPRTPTRVIGRAHLVAGEVGDGASVADGDCAVV